ncbi:hypothetical protein Tco_0025534 [Tanacetum coccineum]
MEDVDGLNGWTEIMNQRVQTLETALQEVRTENQDLQTRLSTSECNERCMVACILWLKGRINTLEKRPPGPQGSLDGSQTMPPRRLRGSAVERLIADRVAKVIAEHERNRPNPVNNGGVVAPNVHGCTYKTFMNGRALTWWIGNVHTLGFVNVNSIPWNEFKAMTTTKYCPTTEIQRMEQELWTLTLKGNDIEGYNNVAVRSSYLHSLVVDILYSLLTLRLSQGKSVVIEEVMDDNEVQTVAGKKVATDTVKEGKLLLLEWNDSIQDGMFYGAIMEDGTENDVVLEKKQRSMYSVEKEGYGVSTSSDTSYYAAPICHEKKLSLSSLEGLPLDYLLCELTTFGFEQGEVQILSQLDMLRDANEVVRERSHSSLLQKRQADMCVEDDVEFPFFANNDEFTFTPEKAFASNSDEEILSDDEGRCNSMQLSKCFPVETEIVKRCWSLNQATKLLGVADALGVNCTETDIRLSYEQPQMNKMLQTLPVPFLCISPHPGNRRIIKGVVAMQSSAPPR